MTLESVIDEIDKKCMDFKPRKEAHDDEDITAKIIAIAFQFGMVLGFTKKYDEIDKVMEELKKAITPEQRAKSDVFDKIRAEIADLLDGDVHGDYHRGYNLGLIRAVRIINKYEFNLHAESEDKE